MGEEKVEHSYFDSREVKWYSCFEKWFGKYTKIKHSTNTSSSNPSPRWIWKRVENTDPCKISTRAHCMRCSGVAGSLRPPQATHPQGLACGWPQLMTQEVCPAQCYTLKCHMKDPTGAEQSQQLRCQWALPSGADCEIPPPAKTRGSHPRCPWSRSG